MDVIINLQQPLPKRSTCEQQAANRLKPWNGDLSETGAKKNDSNIQRTKVRPEQRSSEKAAQ